MKPQNQDHKTTAPAPAPALRVIGSFDEIRAALRAASGGTRPLPCPLCNGRGTASAEEASAKVCAWCSGDGYAEEPATTYQRRTARPGYELTGTDAPARRIKVQQRRTTREAGPYSTRRTIAVPSLQLSGKWLEWCGLTPGAVAYIEVNPCGLVITVAPATLPAAPTASSAAEPVAVYGEDDEPTDYEDYRRSGQEEADLRAEDEADEDEADEDEDEDEQDDRPASEFVPLLLLPSGDSSNLMPSNGISFQLEQLYQSLICQRVEVVPLGDTNEILIIDEEGALSDERERNLKAERIWWSTMPAARGLPLYGRVIYCHTSQLR